MTSAPALRSRTVLLALVTVLTFALVLVAPVPARAAFLNYDVGSEQEFRNALADCEDNAEDGCWIELTQSFSFAEESETPLYEGDASIGIGVDEDATESVVITANGDGYGFLQVTDISVSHFELEGFTVRGFNNPEGGIVLYSGGDLVLRQMTFEQNTANPLSGIVGFNGSLGTVTQTSFMMNGVAPSVLVSHGSVVVVGSTFYANQTPESNGAAVSVFNGHAQFHHSTLVDNYSDMGGAVMLNNASLSLVHVTMAGNSAGGGGQQIRAEGDSTVTSYGTVVTGNGNPFTAACDIAGTDNRNSAGYNYMPDASCVPMGPTDITGLDPQFISIGDYGFATPVVPLQPTSPLVDAIPGECGADTYGADQRGMRIPMGSGCDIGAFELFNEFNDVLDAPSSHTFLMEISSMWFKGLVNGYEDGTFRPSAPVSRQAMAAFMYRFEDEPEFEAPSQPTFSDVPTDHPFYKEIEWLAAEGLTTGYPDGTYRPSNTITRQAVAAFFYRLQDEPGLWTEGEVFSDVPEDHPFFTEITFMYEWNYSTGYEDGTYRPSNTISRQAMAAFLERADD